MPKFQKKKKTKGKDGEKRFKLVSSGAPSSRGKLPTKRTINFAQVGVKKTNVTSAVAGIVLVILAAGLFGKFCVADRLAAMSRADQEVQQLQSRLDEQYARIVEYGAIEDEYAHYTVTGMTEEELSLVDRAKVINMIEREIDITETSTSWSLSSNVLTLNVRGDTLQDINVLARRLEKYDLVNMCSVTNAVKEEVKQSRNEGANGTVVEVKTIVRANIIAYLEEPQEEAQEEAQEGEGSAQ